MKIFVYGTLKNGYGNNVLMQHDQATHLGDAVTTPEYHLFSFGHFPGLTFGDQRVKGEVWEVNNINPFDRLEGHPNWYRRQPVNLEGWEGVEAYIIPPEDARNNNTFIEDNGQYLEFRR